MTAVLVNLAHEGIDADGNTISLLENIFPYDGFLALEVYRADGGDFDNATGYRNDIDAGDFDLTLSTSGYDFNAGNFDTGEEVPWPAPPVTDPNLLIDGGIDYTDPNRFFLIDNNDNPVYIDDIPRGEKLQKSVIDLSINIAINQAFGLDIRLENRVFLGYDYGGAAPDFGYGLDFGSIETPLEVNTDFNSITDPSEPFPNSFVL
jgi:hypothetical protein